MRCLLILITFSLDMTSIFMISFDNVIDLKQQKDISSITDNETVSEMDIIGIYYIVVKQVFHMEN